MADNVNLQSETGVLLVHYTDKNNVLDLIEGVESLKNIKDNPELTEVIDNLLHRLGIKINISDRNGVLEFLRDLAKISPNKAIEEIDIKKDVVEEKIEVSEEPKTKLSQEQINNLVEEYDTATKERQSKIKELLAKYEQLKPNEVDRFISRQKEMALANKKVEEFSQNISKKYDEKVADKIKNVILGEELKVDGVDGVKGKEINQLTRNFMDKNPEIIRKYQLFDVGTKLEIQILKTENILEIAELKKVKQILLQSRDTDTQGPDILTNKSRYVAEQKLISENKLTEGQCKQNIFKTQFILDSAHNSPVKFEQIINNVKELSVFGRKALSMTKYGSAIEEIVSKMSTNPEVARIITSMQRISNAHVKLIEFGMKIPGVNKLIMGTGDVIGGAAMVTFIEGSHLIMAEQGYISGAISVFKLITTGAGALEGAAGVEGITTLSSTLAAWQAVPVLGQVILVVALAISAIYASYKIYNNVANKLKSVGFNFLWGVRDFFTGIFGDNWFGKTVGTVAQFGFNAMVGFGIAVGALFGPILAAGMATMTTLIAPVIIGLVILFGGMGAIVGGMVSTQVPPPPLATGGTCVPKTETPISGEINCKQDYVTDQTGASISKTDFVDLANSWSPGGKNFAAECYNDVVAQSKCAGINPDYALWVWLHESGASNYGNFPDVSDFGVVYKNHNDFKDQITEFVKLDPATICINDPRVNGNYWLAFSINFLIGTDLTDMNKNCDPNRSDTLGFTGLTYEAELRKTFSLVGPLPTTIHGTKDPASCIKNTTTPGVRKPNEYTAPDGTLMVCDGPVNEFGIFEGGPGGGAYDPDAPPLVGEIVKGECSVSKSVYLTKQCGQAWSNKSLPGGSGTICSAGCGPSSVSSMVRTINGSFTPDTIIFEDKSPYKNMDGAGSSLGQAQESLTNHGFTAGNLGGCDQEDIANWICAGKAVIILANSYTGSGGGYIGHILPVVAVSGGKLITKDPYYSNTTPFEGGIQAGRIKDLLQCLTVDLKKD